MTQDETFSDHRLIRFCIEGIKTESQIRRKMNQQQKEAFMRAIRGLANHLRGGIKGSIDVDRVEGLSANLIQGLITYHKENSSQNTVKI